MDTNRIEEVMMLARGEKAMIKMALRYYISAQQKFINDAAVKYYKVQETARPGGTRDLKEKASFEASKLAHGQSIEAAENLLNKFLTTGAK